MCGATHQISNTSGEASTERSCAAISQSPDCDLRAVIPEDGHVISEEMCRSDDLPSVVDGVADCAKIGAAISSARQRSRRV